MLNKTYSCGICQTIPDQVSHHKMHLDTQKHADKRELFELRLKNMSADDLLEKYMTLNISDIVNETETVLMQKPKSRKMKSAEPCEFDPTTTQPDINTKTRTTEKQDRMISNSQNITNKEALRDKIHEIHNYLRNHGAGYGMNALKVFNVLYGLKKIEEKGLIDKVQLKRPECEFSHLFGLAERNEDERLAEVLFGTVLDSIHASKIKYIMFNELPRNLKGSVLSYLVKEINKITEIEKTCNVLLSGKIYEYFIGRDESAISELGAYFTDRHIVDFILDKLNPEIDAEGMIGSMVDMFGGSGGFTTGYIDRLIKHGDRPVRWDTEISKISHFDMNEDVIKSAGLEIFCMTGELPLTENLKYANTFRDEFGGNKYKYILTNPPYGGDKSKSSDRQNKRDKIKEYIKAEMRGVVDEGVRIHRQKQLKDIEAEEKQEKLERENTTVCLSSCSTRINRFARDHKLKGTDKEACSLMLMMDMLEQGGTAIGVLKEGVFFNKTYKDLRRCLVENFNVREVISVPQDQFENTSTKTSIVIFDNSEVKTNTVVFSELIVDKYEADKFADIDGKIYLAENKGDIYGLHAVEVSRASLSELLANDICSLNGKDYNKHVLIVNIEYNLINLSDLCDFKLGTRITKKNNEVGDIPVYGGGDASFYTNKNNREKGSLIVSRYAMSKECVRLVEHNFYLNDSGLSIESKEPSLQKYINYILLSDYSQEYIYQNCTSGSIQRNININLFNQFNIPIPKSPSKIQEWVDKISAPYNESIEKRAKVKELETFVQNRIKEIGEMEECDEVEFKNICSTKKGKQLSKSNFAPGIYPVIGGGISPTGYHSEYNFNENTILCSSSGNNAGFISKYNSKVWASDCFAIISNCEFITNNYLYYILKSKQQQIFDLQNGSAQPHIYSCDLNKHIRLKIPKNKELIHELDTTFQQIETLQSEVKHADESYKTYISELSKEALML